MRLTTRQLFMFILFLGLLIMTARPVADPDFWWHLRTGQLIAETGVIPHSDPYSLTFSGTPWVAHEWLTELIIFNLYKLGGTSLLIVVFSLLITSAFLLGYLQSAARPYAAGFVLLLAALATAPTWGVRPQMVSLLFSAAFMYILDRTRQNGGWKILILLPVLTLIWVNMHGGYILGFALVGLHITGEFFELLLSKLRHLNSSVHRFYQLIIILIACLLCSLVNPNFVEILVYPFKTLASPSMMNFIQEWFSPDFQQLEWMPLAALIFALIAAPLIARRPVQITRILLVLFFGFFALRSMRNVPIFALSAIPVLADQMTGISLIKKTSVKMAGISKWLNPLLLALVLLITGLKFFTTFVQQDEVVAATYPQSAVNWISSNRPKGNLFNSYGWGGYLIWRLYPEYKVYIDGRADIYGDQFIYDYISVYNGQAGWDEALKHWEVQLVLIEPQSGLARELRDSDKWQVTYEDDLCVLFTENMIII